VRLALRWLHGVAIAIDQLGNALGAGDPDETVSSRMGKALHRSRFSRWACGQLDRVDPGHCVDAIEGDEGGHGAF